MKIVSHKTHIFYDKVIVCYITKHPVFHVSIMHIEIDFYFIREKILIGSLHVECTLSQEHIIDIMTKVLPSSKFVELWTKVIVLPKPLAYGMVLDTKIS